MSEPTREQMVDALVAEVANWPATQLRHYANVMVDNYVQSRLVTVVQNEVRWALSETPAEHVERAYNNLPKRG